MHAQTKIVCTLGPVSSSAEVLRELISAGMDVVRLNFSHGDHDSMVQLFNTVRKVTAEFSEQVSTNVQRNGKNTKSS